MPSHTTRRFVVATACCALICLAGPGSAEAQTNRTGSANLESTRFQIGLHGLVGGPLGDFADNVDTAGGINVDFTYAIGPSPFRVGGGVGVLFYQRGTRQEPLSLTIPDVLVDVTTSTNLVSPYFLFRFQPRDGRVRPYVDGRVGFNYLTTRTTASSEDSQLRFAQTTHADDFGLTAGVGGGAMIGLYDWTDGRFGLDFGAHYVYGAPLEYLVPGTLGAAAGVADFEPRRSRTDLFTVHLGAHVEF